MTITFCVKKFAKNANNDVFFRMLCRLINNMIKMMGTKLKYQIKKISEPLGIINFFQKKNFHVFYQNDMSLVLILFD